MLLAGVLALCLASCTVASSSSSTGSSSAVQPEPKAALTYVAIGASDTYGIGADDPQSQNWPVDLVGLINGGARLINLGIPAIHLHEALNVELPVALDSHPNLVTIWLAVNDLADGVSLATYKPDLDQLLARLTSALPHARILVANVPDLTLLPRFQGVDSTTLHQQIDAYNAVIAFSVARYHVRLVDLYQRWGELARHPEYISGDGFHPNALGYSELAKIFYQVLQEKS